MSFRNKSVNNKKLSNMPNEINLNPNLNKEISFYGEALRMREELLPLPERQEIEEPSGNLVTIPARDGIDVLTATESELITVLENSQTPNNGKDIDYIARISFILRVITLRFPTFNPQITNLKSKWISQYAILKDKKIDDVEFLGEAGFSDMITDGTDQTH